MRKLLKLLCLIMGISTGINVFAQDDTNFLDITESLNLPDFTASKRAGHGSSVNLLDIDLDGSLDLFFTANADYPNYLVLNKNGTWETTVIGNEGKISRSAVWFDYDADGDLDVLVTNDCQGTDECYDTETFQLFKSEGSSFIDVSTESGLAIGKEIRSARATIQIFYGGGTAVGDLNLDGYLDIVMGRWNGDVFLFMNNGDGTFRDESSMLGLNEMSPYFQPVILDFTGDGWPDIYMTVDKKEPNHFLRNDDGQSFTDIAKEINLDSKASDMGLAFGDYDNDGDYDFYIGNIERSGNIEGNRLFQNQMNEGTLAFLERAEPLGVQDGGWGWGVTFFDANNDGWLDLAATNGWETALGGFNPINYPEDQSKLWLNENGEGFVDRSSESSFDDELIGSALVAGDIDRDGDLDLVQGLTKTTDHVHARILENQFKQLHPESNFLIVQPRMIGQNKQAIGANVEIHYGSGYQQRPIISGNSFYGQEPAEAFFGLGDLQQVDEVVVTWPGGQKTTVQNVSSNQVIEITDQDVLHAPGKLSIASSGDGALISWGLMSTTEESFEIQKSLDTSFENPTTFVLSADQLAYYDAEIEDDTYYYYRVRSVNQSQSSQWSNIINYRKISALSEPTNLNAELVEITSTRLNWIDQSDGEENFILLRSPSQEMLENFEIILPSNVTEYIDTGLEPDTEYHYAVLAKNEDISSELSNIVSITTGKFINTILSVDEPTELAVFPNPSNGSFTLSLISDHSSPITVELIDLDGKRAGNWIIEPDNLVKTLFRTNHLSGPYLLEVTAGKLIYKETILFK